MSENAVSPWVEIAIKGGVALVDAADAPLVQRHRWWIRTGYAYGKERVDGRQVTLLMHRVVLGAPPGSMIDHANGNRLDNRRQNLRFCDAWQNASNSPKPPNASGFRGVFPKGNVFAARISKNWKRFNLGCFATAEAAARAYDAAAKRHHGDFALLNFPEAQ